MKKSLFDRFYKQQKMDKASPDGGGVQTGSDLTWPPSPPKRPRTGHTVTDDRRGKTEFDFPAPTFPTSEELMRGAERGGFGDVDPRERPRDAKLNVAEAADEGVTTDDAGGGSAPTATDKAHHLTGNQPGEALEEETPGDGGLAAGSEGDERQVRRRAVGVGAPSEEVTSPSDCTQRGNHGDVSSGDPGADRKRDELGTSDTRLSEEDGQSPKPLRDHDYAKPWPNPDGETQAKSLRSEKHPPSEFQIFSVCNLGTKGQDNEADRREDVPLSAAEECAEESVLACDVIADGNTATESVCFEVADFCGAEEASAAGEIIAAAPSEKADHTTETAAAAGISEERAGGDNDAGPFGVIDPAIWSEADREAEERRRGSASAAGGGLSRQAEAPRLSPPYRSGRCHHQGATRQDGDEDGDSCRVRSVVADEPRHTAGGDSGPPGSAPAPPAGRDEELESHDAAGRELKEQSASICFPGGPSVPRLDISRCEDDETAEMKERVESFVTTTRSDKRQSWEAKDGKFKRVVEEERGKGPECLSGPPLTTDVKQEEEHETRAAQRSPGERKERKEVASCDENNRERGIEKKPLAVTSCPGSDALVPRQPDFDRRRNRFLPPTPFDTFQKIQLSPSDDDDNDDIVGLDDLARVPVLGGSPHRVLDTPRLQRRGGVESEDAGSRRTASPRDELPNFTSAAAVVVRDDSSDRRRDSSAVPTGSAAAAAASEVKVCPPFDMRPQFDMVLKELQLFFDISRNEFAEDRGDTSKPLDGVASEDGEPGGPGVERLRDAPSDDADDGGGGLETGGDHPTVRGDGEQEVPLGEHLCQETPGDGEGRRAERLETQQSGRTWSPSFGLEPLLEQLSHRLLEPPRRLGPLKTCTGPRRVGLSKRARTKPLHRPRPYQ